VPARRAAARPFRAERHTDYCVARGIAAEDGRRQGTGTWPGRAGVFSAQARKGDSGHNRQSYCITAVAPGPPLATAEV
jgi:hypothetical protein